MNNTMEGFKKICELDEKILKYDKKINLIPNDLKQIKSALETLNKKFKLYRKKDLVIKNQILERETLITLEKNRFEKLETFKKQIRDQKSFYTLKKKKDVCERITKFLKKEIEELGRKLSEKSPEYAKTKEEHQAIDADIKLEEELIREDNKDLIDQIELLRKERMEILELIEDKINLDVYHKLQEKNIVPPLVGVKDETCTGCLMNFPAQFFQELLTGNLDQCPFCSRLVIYIDEGKKEDQ